MGNGRRSGHAYRKLCQLVKARPDGYVCCRCHAPIDPTLRWPHRMSWSLDHLLALHMGGALLDPGNAAAAHLTCNCSHGNSIKQLILTQVW